MKVLILTADSNGAYPVPASKGGAVATLIEQLVEANNRKKECELYILSFYDVNAYNLSMRYPNIHFMWVKIPKIFKLFDKIFFYFMKKIKGEYKAISFKTIFSLLFYIKKAKKIVKKIEFDKIVLENNVPLAMVLKGNNITRDYYYHFHNVPRISANCESVFQNSKKIICVSQFVADRICSKDSAIGKIEKEKIALLYNCVDTQLFKPIDKNDNKILELKKKYNLKIDDKVIIYTGRLIPEKGVDKLLLAMKKLPDNIKAIIVGSYHYNSNVKSDYQDKLKDIANQLKSRIIFYNLADIAVIPSVWEEPAGLTNMEAMSCGIPVITTKSGGIPEYVGNSIILDINDDLPSNIANRVLELLKDEKLYSELSVYGISRVNKIYSKEDYFNNFISIIFD